MFRVLTSISKGYLYSEALLENITGVCKQLGIEMISDIDAPQTVLKLFKDEIFIKNLGGLTYSQLFLEISLTMTLNA